MLFQIQLYHFVHTLVKKCLKYVFCQNLLHKSSNTKELQASPLAPLQDSLLTNGIGYSSHMLLALMIPLSLLSSVQPESSEGCACLSVKSMDPYKAGQNMIKKILLEELEAQSHNSDM